MAIIRTKNLRSEFSSTIKENINSPEKLLQFAKNNNIILVPLDIEKLTNLLEISIKFDSLKNNLSGILFKNNNKWTIIVNKNYHKNRKKYVIAYGLGHYFLHKYLYHNFEDEITFRGGYLCTEEEQCHKFARTILLPEKEFKNKIKSGTKKVKDLAKFFNVSTITINMRAKDLGLIYKGK